MTGETDHAPRGDYASAGPDFTVAQRWDDYTPAEHALWRRLYERQSALLSGRACREFAGSVARLGLGAGIPRFDEANEALAGATGWTIVGVPGLLPDRAFFAHLAERRFPVTVWLRRPEEFDYIVEPDLFHDFFGHVPLLFDPVFADYLEAYGRGGLKADALGALEMLARLYWYTVEFGLIETQAGLRAYGAGILSSGGELPYCLEDPRPNRLGFDLPRILRTRYKIDTFQETYFVIRDFRELFEATAPDFTPIYRALEGQAPIGAGEVLASDRVL